MKKLAALNLSESRIQLIIWTVLCLMPIVGMAVDLVAPSLPAISIDLGVSAKIAQDVISIYLLGYALGNFLTGFLTDALGRRALLRMGLLSFIVVSLLPVLFPHAGILLLSRFLQGLTIGGVAVLARTIISDILPADKLVRLGTLIGTMWGLGPVVGPIIGGYLQYYIGWKAGFCFFAIISLIGFIAVFFIVPETLQIRHSLKLNVIKHNLLEVLNHRLFMTMVYLMGLMYSLLITFNTAGPFLIQTQLHYSPVFFGHLAFCLGIVFLASTFICRYLLKKYVFDRVYLTVVNTFLIISVINVIISYFVSNNIVLVAVASGLMFFACGFIFPLSMGKGLSLFRHISGTAAAVMYLINILITGLVSFLVGFVNVQGATALLWVYMLLLFLGALLYWSQRRSAKNGKLMNGIS